MKLDIRNLLGRKLIAWLCIIAGVFLLLIEFLPHPAVGPAANNQFLINYYVLVWLVKAFQQHTREFLQNPVIVLQYLGLVIPLSGLWGALLAGLGAIRLIFPRYRPHLPAPAQKVLLRLQNLAVVGIGWLAKIHPMLAGMILLQLLWLAVTWLTGAAANWVKIPILIGYSIAAGAVALLAPSKFLDRLDEFGKRLSNTKFLWPTIIVAVLAVGGLYAYYQCLWTDEETSFQAAQLFVNGGVMGLLRKYTQVAWLAQQHPPLMPILNGTAMRLLGMHWLVPRLVTLVFTAATIVVLYPLGAELYNREAGFSAVVFLLSFPLFLRLGSTGLSDIAVTFFFSLSLYLTLNLVRKPSYWKALIAGGVMITGILVKYTMVLIYPVLLGWYLASPAFKERKQYLAVALSLTAIAAIAWFVLASRIGVLVTQIKTIIEFATVVFRTRIGRKFLLETLTTRLPAGLGVYNFPIMILGCWHLFKRKNQSDRFTAIWIAVIFLVLMVTLPDHRYFMPVFPAIALLMAQGSANIPQGKGRALILSLLYCAGALYLFVDWQRSSHLFLP